MSSNPIVAHGTLDLLLGITFVLLYSGQRFNTPSTNRSSTTAGRFFLALGLYCVAALTAYFLLVKFLHLVTLFGQGDPTDLPEYAKELSSPLLVALLMTTLLPKLPLLSTVDQWLLKQLQNMAAIPYEVRRLSAELRNQGFRIRPELEQAVRHKLKNEGFDDSDVRLDAGDGPWQLWTRLTALVVQLETWESDRKMAGYLAAFGEDWKRAQARHEAMMAKARSCFKLLRESAADAETEKARQAALQYAEDFSEQVTEVHHGLLDFISRGVLHAEITDAARTSRLVALGFAAGAGEHDRFTLNQMMSLFGVFGILTLSTFVLFSTDPTATHGMIVARAIMISVIYSVAVACVVLPRESWAFAKCEPGKARPVAFYIVAGLMAAGISQLIGFGFNCVLAQSLDAGRERYLLTYPWSVMTFTTSVMTGFLIDDRPRPGVPRLVWRSLEGIAGAVVMLVAAALTYNWLTELAGTVSFEVKSRLGYSLPPLRSTLGTAGAVGFAIGWLVPTWYREAPRARADVPVARLIEAH